MDNISCKKFCKEFATETLLHAMELGKNCTEQGSNVDDFHTGVKLSWVMEYSPGSQRQKSFWTRFESDIVGDINHE
jgi:hypothetical protein